MTFVAPIVVRSQASDGGKVMVMMKKGDHWYTDNGCEGIEQDEGCCRDAMVGFWNPQMGLQLEL